LGIGTWENLITAKPDDSLISVLEKFIKLKISGVPILDNEGKTNSLIKVILRTFMRNTMC
jgi:CBS domain-containing protein